MAIDEKILDILIENSKWIAWLKEATVRIEKKQDYTNWKVMKARADINSIETDIAIIKERGAKLVVQKAKPKSFFERDWKEIFAVLSIIGTTFWYLITQILIYLDK